VKTGDLGMTELGKGSYPCCVLRAYPWGWSPFPDILYPAGGFQIGGKGDGGAHDLPTPFAVFAVDLNHS
jgi:hypothetical protein